MHRYALLHWRFFDRFVSEQTNWLAPDNFQEDPKPVVALRTSPTNIGLQLLATVSAYDLGFITLDDMARRLELAFRTLERMRRLQGHFYNWYDLTDLRVLEPAYVSTVDSGNLAGHLIALRQACLALIEQPLDGRVGRALDTALPLADERRKQLIPNHSAGKQLRAGAQAGITVRAAYAVYLQAGPASGDALRQYERRSTRRDSGPGLAEALTEWTSWSLRLIERTRRVDRRSRESRSQRIARQLAAPRWRPRCSAGWRRSPTGPTLRHGDGLPVSVRQAAEAVRHRLAGQHPHSRRSYYDLLASEARLASFSPWPRTTCRWTTGSAWAAP